MKALLALLFGLTVVSMSSPAAARILCGTIRYADYDSNNNATFIGNKAVRAAKVTVWRPGYFQYDVATSSSGFYTTSVPDSLIPPGATYYMTVYPHIVGVAHVKDHVGTTLGYTKSKVLPSGTGAVDLSYTVPKTIPPVTAYQSAIFNVLDNIYNAWSYAAARRHSAYEDVIPEVEARFPDEPPDYGNCISGCQCTYNGSPEGNDEFASAYIPSTRCAGNPVGRLHITGGVNSYMDWTPIHEYFHHLQYEISRPEPTMKSNTTVQCNAQPTPAHAWHEGFPQYLAGAVLNQVEFGRLGGACPFSMENARSCADCSTPWDYEPTSGGLMQAVWLTLWDFHDTTNEWHDRVNGGVYYPGGGYPADWIFKTFDGPMDWFAGVRPDIFQFRNYWTPYPSSVQDLNLIMAKHRILPPACEGMCGGYQVEMGCYCDAECVGYGDCCGDGSACETCHFC